MTVLSNFQDQGFLIIWIIEEQGSTVLAVGVSWVLGTFFSHLSTFFLLLFTNVAYTGCESE